MNNSFKLRNMFYLSLLICSISLSCASSFIFANEVSALHTASAVAAIEVNLIESITAKQNKIRVVPNADFKKKYLKGNFFVEYEPDIDVEQFDSSIQSMPFVMNVISIVWISGKIYYIDEMDTELYYSLERVKNVLKVMYPKTPWNGELRVRKLVDHKYNINAHFKASGQHMNGIKQVYNEHRGITTQHINIDLNTNKTENTDPRERTALLYSGGIDSTSTAYDHLDKKQLLITAWGHWDLPLNEQSLWKVRKHKISSFAHSFGNEATFLRSNYAAFLNWEYLSHLTPEIKKWRLGAVEGIGWAGLTAPILLSKGYPVLRIASSHTWLYPYPSAASPYIDNNLRYCGLRVLHDQFDMTRLNKIEFICKTVKERNIKPPFFKICSLEKREDHNCCNCRKCLSTIACFLAVGENPRKYGMHIDVKSAVYRIHALLKPHSLNYYTILLFKGIQAKIRKNLEQDVPYAHELESLLSIDLDNKRAFDTKSQHKLNWNEMQQLCIELEIPEMVDGMHV